MTDTIAAISTAMGNSGINIIRISGEEAFDIAKKLLHWDDVKIKCVSSHTIHHGYVYDGEERIDEVLVSFFKSPKTYTREDIVEINCHGGSYVTKKILGLAIRTGARIAEPGEFTKRAFLNGRIDLSQAEAVMDVIKAQNDYALKSAEKQLSGGIREKINPVKNQILSDVALIEASLDDPENIPLDEERIKELSGHINDEIAKLEQIIKNFENGKLLNANINNVFSVNDDYKEYLDVMIGKFKEALKLYEGKKGVTVTVNNSDTKITTLIKFNLNKMSEDDKKVIGFDSKDSRKNIKAFYEGEGFSCE